MNEVQRLRDEAEFRAFVVGSQRRLLHVADLLTGDRGRAEDVVQHALAKVYLAWPRLRSGQPEAYARRCIVNAHTDWWRRRTWFERPVVDVDDRAGPGDHAVEFAQRDAVLRALAGLTTRERAVIVLRYYAQLSEAEIAAELGCAPGTVKSTAARALSRLRTSRQLNEGVTL